MAMRSMLASTSGGSASAWQVSPAKARLSVALGGDVGSRCSRIWAGVTACKGCLAAQFAGECLDVLDERQEHADAGWIVVADMQHLGRTIMLGERDGELVPVGGGVETAAAHHRHAEWMGDTVELRN